MITGAKIEKKWEVQGLVVALVLTWKGAQRSKIVCVIFRANNCLSCRQIPGPPIPEFLKEFAGMLPLSLPWNGPIADVEHIFRAMLLVDFPPRSCIEQAAQQQQQQMQKQLTLQHQQQLQQQAAEFDKNSGLGDDDGASGVVSKRPAHDIFRSRQKQKLSKLG